MEYGTGSVWSAETESPLWIRAERALVFSTGATATALAEVEQGPVPVVEAVGGDVDVIQITGDVVGSAQ
jgi:hypothetical protein